MNLAPVEQYFAEFLSILESRKLMEDGETILTEPLIDTSIFNKYPDLVYEFTGIQKPKEKNCKSNRYDILSTSDEQEEYQLTDYVFEKIKKEGLRIPQNVLVIGTVNMDDTTHQFSRKVIDRAMTIEMNEVKFDTFFDSNNELGYTDEPLEKEYFLPKYTTAGKALESIPEDAEIIKKDVPILLEQLNEALDGTPFKIAYRVQNELVLYFASLRQEDEYQGWTTEGLLNKAMDGILMMKVLPRIEGDKDLLEECLINLAEFAKNYLSASMKISEMQSRLKKSQFTSFWP
jgi:5-methylcytosine-specific restriction endonuclease McrBC GTP-binding regulatory subunit McrB